MVLGRRRLHGPPTGFQEPSEARQNQRGSVYALDVLDLPGDILDVVNRILAGQGAGQRDDALSRGHSDVDALADAVASELGFHVGGDLAIGSGELRARRHFLVIGGRAAGRWGGGNLSKRGRWVGGLSDQIIVVGAQRE